MGEHKSQGQAAANERSRATRNGRKGGSQSGRMGGEASAGASSGEGTRAQAEDPGRSSPPSRKSVSR